MASLPFSGLLDALRAKGLRLGVRDYLAFAALWTRLEAASVAELRTAAGALLGRSPDEVRLVVETFDELYGARSEPPPPPPPPPESTWERLRRRLWSATALWLLIFTLVVLAGLGVWLSSLLTPPLPTPPIPARSLPEPYRPPRPEETLTIVTPPPPSPRLPDPPRASNRGLLLSALTVSGLAVLLALQRPRARAADRRHRERAWRQARAALSGPTAFTQAPLAPPVWFDRRDLEDAATLLGRAFTTGQASARLDVSRSIRLTIDGGGLTRFAFEASTASGALLLLEDIGPEMDSWRAKTAAFLQALTRQGVRLDRWVFDGTPALVARETAGERISLDQLAHRGFSNGVLIISSGSGLGAETPTPGVQWRDALTAWTRRSWLNPVVTRATWRPELASVPVNVWPFTGHGVLDAAADLAVDPEGRRGRRGHSDAAATVLADDVERLKRLIAIAGHPNLELVEVLRQRFIPDTPDDTVLYVLREAEHGSPREVRLAKADVRRLVTAERRENPERERAVRQYVADLLAAQPPPAGSLAALRWQLALAAQRLGLAQLGVGDAAAPTTDLQALTLSPIWDEVGDAIAGLDTPGAEGIGRRTRRGEIGAPAALPRGTTGSAKASTWLRPRPFELAAAGLVTALVTGGLQTAGAFTGPAIEHVADAYRLEYSPPVEDPSGGGVLVAARNPGAPTEAPAQVQLFRDGEAFGQPFAAPANGVAEQPIAPGDSGHHFQLRAALPAGNLALSQSVWVGAPQQLSAVSVNALPWAIGRILDAQTRQPVTSGDFTTPFVVHLPPGSYLLELSHQDYGVVTRPLDVQAGRDLQEIVPMPGFDPAETARRLAAPRAQAR